MPMTEINDIDQHIVSATSETENCKDNILHFQPDWQKKRVIDLACGSGWLGAAALRGGAESVRFADARSTIFQVPEQDNHSFELVDINNCEMLDHCLRDIDTIIYCGHFYHASNHEEILDAFERSSCSELFFESKVFYQYDDYHENFPDIQWMNELTNSSDYNAWHASAESVQIGHSNFKWMHEHLSRRFDIKNIAVFEKQLDSYFCGDRQIFYKKTLFHCVKKSI
jgi:hypothetical protein